MTTGTTSADPPCPRPPAAGRDGPDLPGDSRAALGNRRPDRQPAGPQLPACPPCPWPPTGLRPGGTLIIAFLVLTGRPGWPSGRAAWTRITVIGRAGRGVPELLFHGRVADLGQPGHPDHDRERPRSSCWPSSGSGVRAGSAGSRAAPPALALIGLACWSACRPAVPRERRAGQCGHGGPRRHRVRHAHADQRPAGRGPGRPDRDRLRVRPRRPDPAAGGRGFRRTGLHPRPGHPRPAGRARHRPDGRGLHAVLPRPADRPGGHRRAAVPARAAHRHGPRRADPR